MAATVHYLAFCPTTTQNHAQINIVFLRHEEVDRVELFEPTTSGPPSICDELTLHNKKGEK